MYWQLISRVRKPIGRRPVTKEVRELIFKMAAENPTWGAPRIHGELVTLGFDISERSVSRWMRRAPTTPNPSQRWLTFLRNHHEAIAAMDFFSVLTVTFHVLYVFFILGDQPLSGVPGKFPSLFVPVFSALAISPRKLHIS